MANLSFSPYVAFLKVECDVCLVSKGTSFLAEVSLGKNDGRGAVEGVDVERNRAAVACHRRRSCINQIEGTMDESQ